MSEFLQYIFSGITVGAVYALVALGFTLIYNASNVVNFAQGEFVMIGGMVTAFLYAAGLPLWAAAILAIAVAAVVGILLNKLAIEQARGASVISLIVITIGASIFLRGLAAIVFDKQIHNFPAFTGEAPIRVFGASILPQSLWVLGGGAAMLGALYLFLTQSILGKAVLATANNRLAAKLVGINTNLMMTLSFGLSAAIGGLAGVLATPVTLVAYDVGVGIALKGFAAAMLGGMGSPLGAIAGGLLLGLIESMTAAYISSEYKEAAAFIVILVVLFVMPSGLFGHRQAERV